MTTGRINQVACDECCTPPARKRKHAQHKHGIRLPTRNPPITDGDRTIESCLSHRGATPRTERPTKWTTDPSKHHAIPDGRRSVQTECNAPKRRAQGHTSSDHSQMYHQCLAAEAHHSLLAPHRIVQPNLSVQLFMRVKEAEAPPHTSKALATLDVGDMPTIERSAARRVCSLEQVPRGKPFHPHLFSRSYREPQGPRRPLHTSGRFDHNSPKCRISPPLTEWKLESCCTEASCSVK
mmetsp:Transcript_1736/g.3033  ORF Transcript_1736/g.3033 Transcript_1736/m.3033 type:complete len:237 (+) Transcript_1736:895-1605(+)